jgi:hypothetical protein
MDNGVLPENVLALVPKYLEKQLIDPFDGKPLRIRRFDKGIEVFSVAEDDQPDDNAIEFHGGNGAIRPIKNVRYRLWDVSERAQPSSHK